MLRKVNCQNFEFERMADLFNSGRKRQVIEGGGGGDKL